jgi:hypothetical protein
MDLEVLKNTEHIDDQLDYIFQTIDELLLDGKFDEVDTIIIKFIDDNDFSLDLYVGFLTITGVWLEKLKYRNLLRKYAYNKGLEKYNSRDVKNILKGL